MICNELYTLLFRNNYSITTYCNDRFRAYDSITTRAHYSWMKQTYNIPKGFQLFDLCSAHEVVDYSRQYFKYKSNVPYFFPFLIFNDYTCIEYRHKDELLLSLSGITRGYDVVDLSEQGKDALYIASRFLDVFCKEFIGERIGVERFMHAKQVVDSKPRITFWTTMHDDFYKRILKVFDEEQIVEWQLKGVLLG